MKIYIAHSKKDSNIAYSLKSVSSHFIQYENEKEMVEEMEKIIKGEESKI
ncbi:MAG: hypothetical protein HFH31_04140 [Bacilli bacterium]|nr:hypothetical protein [Bacilli bacterium]